MPTVKRKPAAKTATAKAKIQKKKDQKYGHYESYQDYSENILVKPMRRLFGLLKKKDCKDIKTIRPWTGRV